jgi:CRP-like cAMP-binding protein
VPEYRRLRFIVFDCEQLDGMDASASKAMKKLVEEADKIGIRVLWSHMSEELKGDLVSRTIVQDQSDLYDDVTQAVDYVHKLAMEYRIEIHRRFMSLHPSFGIYRGLLRCWASFEPFVGTFSLDIQRFGCVWQYCTIVEMKKKSTVLYRRGERVMDLYLVHSGAVGCFNEDPTDVDAHPNVWEHTQAIYKQGWFLNREMLSGSGTKFCATALEDGEVLVWSERNWIQMARERPYMARAISKMIIKQQSRDDELKSLEMHAQVMKAADRPIDLMEDDAFEATPSLAQHDFRKKNPTLAQRKGGKKRSSKIVEEGGDQARASFAAATGPRVSQVLESAKIFGMIAHTGTGNRPGCPLGLGLPEEMVSKLVGIQTAQVLHGFNLFETVTDVDEDVVMPPMPKGFRQNLEIAFDTFCRPDQDTIPWAVCSDVLMFAGIFNSLLDKSLPPRRAVTRAEFLAVGHRATMSPLTCTMVRKIQEIFNRWDDDGNGRLDREQLISVFREVFHPELSIEEVEGLSGAWGVGALERMDVLDFLCVFSRFLRIHEQDWSLLSGFHEVMGKRHCTENDNLRAKDLAISSNGLVSQEHAEEMLWAVDWRRDGEGEGKSLPFIDLVAACLMNVDLNPGKLPPPPKNQYCDPDVVGFTRNVSDEDEKKSQTDQHARYVLLKSGKSASTSMKQTCPEMEFAVDPMLSEVDGMVQDLRNCKNYVGSRKSHALEVEEAEDGKSILEAMVCKRETVTQIRTISYTHMETRMELDKQQDITFAGVRSHIYGFCELPSSSTTAQYLSSFMGILIIASVISLFVQPLVTPVDSEPSAEAKMFWRVLETFFTTIFTLEFIIRLSVCNSVGENTIQDFLRTPSNICDFVALLPFYIELILLSSQDGLRLLRTARLMKLIRLLRVSRVMRIQKLAKHGTGFATLAGPVAMVFTVIWGIYLLSDVADD